MNRRYLTLLCGMLALLLLALTGCQSIGGVDVNKVMTNGLNTTSYEGSMKASLEVVPGTAVPGQKDWSALNGTTLTLTTVQMKDKDHGYAKGALTLPAGSIPFELSLTGEQVAIQVEGAKQPVVIDMTVGNILQLFSVDSKSGMLGSLPIDVSTLSNPGDLMRQLGTILTPVLPNPSVIKVDPAAVTVNGKNLDLKKLHAEWKGTEVVGFLKDAIQGLLDNDKALDDLTSILVERMFGPDASSMVKGFAKNSMKKELGDLKESLTAQSLGTSAASALTADSMLAVDLYVDANSMVNKADVTLALQNAGSMKSLKLSVGMDLWNHNQPVTLANTVSTTNALKVDANLKSPMARFLKTLDPSSKTYDFLTNGLKVTRKNISMKMGDGLPGTEIRPYLSPASNKTMVPVRFVSEKLDADVLWNGEKRQVTVTDLLSGRTLIFTLGSRTVIVDGTPQEIDASPELEGGSTYVPARFIAESFGATVGWDAATRTVSIVRN